MATLHIYTDGSCPGNPGPSGWGFLVVRDEDKCIVYEKCGLCANELDEPIARSTNQIAEIMAFERALAMLLTRHKQKEKPTGDTVLFYSDSAYVLNCLKDKWYINWRKYSRGGTWTTSKGEPVANQWLWDRLLKHLFVLENLGYFFMYNKVKSHIKPGHPKYHEVHSPFNERADYLAGQGTKLCIEALSTSDIK